MTSSDVASHKVKGNKLATHHHEPKASSKTIAEQLDDDDFKSAEVAAGRRAPEFIYIDFKARTCGNKMARLFYQLMKAFYTVIWFYFVPFSILFLSFFIPYAYGDTENRYAKLTSVASGTISIIDVEPLA